MAKFSFSASFIGAFLLTIAPNLFAKSSPEFEGTLKDMDGNPIAGTTVRYCASIYSSITDDPSETSCWSTKTDNNGQYEFSKKDLGGLFNFNKNWASLYFPDLKVGLDAYVGSVFNINKDSYFKDFFEKKNLTFISFTFPLNFQVPAPYQAGVDVAQFDVDSIEVDSGDQQVDFNWMHGALTSFDSNTGMLSFAKTNNEGDYAVDMLMNNWNGEALDLKIHAESPGSTFPIDGVYAPQIMINIEIKDLMNVDLADFEQKVQNNSNLWKMEDNTLTFTVDY